MTRTDTKAELDIFFSDVLVSPQVQNDLPEGYLIRPLHKEDFDNGNTSRLPTIYSFPAWEGLLDVLSQLSDVGSISKEQFDGNWEYEFTEMTTLHPCL